MPTPGKSYRVAIIGCGPRGTAGGEAYKAHPRVTLVGLCDLAPERLNALGDKLGVAARFADHQKMIRETKPDIVVIATTADYHFDLAMDVLTFGVNIDVEKPICLDLAQADAVIARSVERGVQVVAHHQYRSGSVMRALGRVVESGRIGQLHHIEGNCKGYYGGYGLMNIGCHLLNNMVKLGGSARSVTALAQTGGHLITAADAVSSPEGMGLITGEFLTATIQLDPGVTATLVHHRLPNVGRPPLNSVVEFVGSEGHLMWKSDSAWFLPYGRFVPGGTYDRWEELPLVLPTGFSAGVGSLAADDYWFVDEYVNALDEGRDHEVGGAEAIRGLETMMAIFESAASGRRVDLPQASREHPLRRWRREQGLGEAPPAPRDYREWLAAEDLRKSSAAPSPLKALTTPAMALN